MPGPPPRGDEVGAEVSVDGVQSRVLAEERNSGVIRTWMVFKTIYIYRESAGKEDSPESGWEQMTRTWKVSRR